MKIRIGTRSSKLAMAQTRMAAQMLESKFSDLNIEIIPVVTKGDALREKPLYRIGGKGVFVAEIERALVGGEIDIAVHSAKDMPVRLAEGTAVGTVLKRGDPRDVLIMRKGAEECSVIGTGSLRRRAGLRKFFPKAEFKDIRGNIDTRIKKLENGEFDAIMLAAAGLERLGIGQNPNFEYRFFSPEELVPAPCQGIIAVQCAEGSRAEELLKKINDPNTFLRFEAEREILRLTGADCTVPLGAYAEISDGMMTLTAEKNSVRVSGSAPVGERFGLAERVVKKLCAEEK